MNAMAPAQWISLVLLSLTIIDTVSTSGIIVEGPSNNTVSVGGAVTLKCRTSRVVNVEWVRGENVLNTTLLNERTYYSVDGNNSLTIHNITLNDDSISRIPNKYMCVVRNATGGILEKSQRAWLFIRSLPAAPTLRLDNYLYSNIRLFYSFPKVMSGIPNITLLVALRVKEKLIRTFNIDNIVASTSEGFYLVTGLNNGTTYTVSVRTKTNVGLSINTSVANVTIPRMVAPGPPRNLSVTVTSRFDAISLTICYYEPADNGGTKNLRGNITNCIVNSKSSSTLWNCTRDVTVLGSSSKGYYLYDNLKEKTKYYFSINFQSDAKQNGPPTSMYFTTPSLEDYKSKGHGLTMTMSVVIGIASLATFICLFRVFCILCDHISKRNTETVTGSSANKSTERLVGEE